MPYGEVATQAVTLTGGEQPSFRNEESVVQGVRAISVSMLGRRFVAAAVISVVAFVGTGVRPPPVVRPRGFAPPPRPSHSFGQTLVSRHAR